jgi:hypothetical protein
MARQRHDALDANAAMAGGSILDRAGAGEQVEALEYEAQPFAPDLRKLGFAEPRDIDALEVVMPGGWSIKAAEDRHQGRFSGSGRAHDGHELPRIDAQVHPAERVHVDFTDVIKSARDSRS